MDLSSSFNTFFTPDRRALRKKIWRLTLPVIVANITVPFVGMVDTAVMGHFDSAHYIGAVAMGSFLFSLVTILFGFLRMATTGLVAQANGADDRAGVILHFLRGTAMALMIGAVVLVFSQPLILLARQLLSASPEVLDGMDRYMTIVAFCGPAACFNMVALGLLFGLQRVHGCMIQLIVINCINIAGNLLLVFGFGMKIEGVALATVLAQYTGTGVSAVLVLRALGGVSSWPSIGWSHVISFAALRQYIGLGRDLTIRTFGIVLGEILVLNSSASLGDVELAASQLGFVLFGIMAFGLDGFAHAAESLVGQAIGKRDRVLLRAAIQDTILLAMVTAMVIGVGVFFASMPFFRLMTSLPEVLAEVEGMVLWMALIPVVSVMAFQLDGVFIGATKATIMRDAMMVSVLVFIPLVYLGRAVAGLDGIWLAFLFLLAMRGVTLWFRLDRVYAAADEPGHRA